MERVRNVIREAYPELEAVFGGHGNYGGHRAPRDHTISFRLKDSNGKFCSNVVWLMPQSLGTLTAADIEVLVSHANGK
jgi:hypothetical protein